MTTTKNDDKFIDQYAGDKFLELDQTMIEDTLNYVLDGIHEDQDVPLIDSISYADEMREKIAKKIIELLWLTYR